MLILSISQDPYAEDPRSEFPQIGTIVGWHRRYSWDEDGSKVWGSPQDFLAEHPSSRYLILPVFLLDHSGLSISTHPFGDPWDSGQIGFIYVSRKTAISELGSASHWRSRMTKRLLSEIEELDSYYQGDCWSYQITDSETSEVIDSCYGFYGDRSFCLSQGKESLRWLCQKHAVKGTIKEET